MKHSCNGDKAMSPTGPSPSLWPEPARPIPTTVRRVQFSTESQMSNSSRAAAGGFSDNQPGIVRPEGAAYSDCSTTPGVESGSTLPSCSSATTCPSLRPINFTPSNIFEPNYPRWYAYPPILPRKFETKPPSHFVMGESFDDLTDMFLKQSNSFQNWVNMKNAERIQLRHAPAYEKLVDELHKYQYIADHGPTPPIRANAKQEILRIEAKLVEERKKFSDAEVQCIRDIEKAWVSFVGLDSHERAISEQRQMSTTPQLEIARPLSKVERLLGSDGSSFGSISQNQPHGAVGVDATGLAVREKKKQTPNLPEKPPAPAGVSPWPDKPYEILIPDWFPVAEARGIINTRGATIEDRFRGLLNYIYQLELKKSQHAYQEMHPNEEGIVKDYTWEKYWHPPNPGWRHEHQKKKGGLWKCRKGPTATVAENKCKICPTAQKPKPLPASEVLERLIENIGQAMAIVARNDENETSERRSSSNHKPSSAEVFRQLDKDMKMWAVQENDPVANTQSGVIPLGAREPWINYNPLNKDLDDSPETAATTVQTDAKQAAGGNKEQRKSHDEDTHKGKRITQST